MNIEFNKYFNLSSLQPDEQQLVVTAITNLVLARMADTIADHLTDAEIDELEKLGQSNNGDAVIGWLNQHIPNFSDGINEILHEESADIAAKVTALTNYALESN